MDGSNDNKELIDKPANLLNDTAEAHHKAFAATEDEDPVGLSGIQITYLRNFGKC
jgi:hypothetical protein